MYKGKKFVASFSGGKDSTLAIYRCLKQGMIANEMITTCPIDAKKSWFHKVDEDILFQISESINIPLTLIKTSGENYVENFESALTKAKENGAEVAVFGDIDIEEHLKWCSDRCNNVGLIPYFPLWSEPREKVVREFVENGFIAKIIVAKHEKLAVGFLGEILTNELLDKMISLDVDVCGENGEYHTIVLDGPIFKKAIDFEVDKKL